MEIDWSNPDSVREYHRVYREKNKVHILNQKRKWRIRNPDSVRASNGRYRGEEEESPVEDEDTPLPEKRPYRKLNLDWSDEEAVNAYRQEMREKHKDAKRRQNREYYLRNKKKVSESKARYYKENVNRIKEVTTRYRESHREEIKKKAREKYEQLREERKRESGLF